MKNLLVLLSYILLINLLLVGCKAEVTESEKAQAAFSRGITLKVHCSKMILIRLSDDAKKVESTETLSEGSSKASATAALKPREFIGEFTYRLSEYADGSREIDCQLTDGSRQFTGHVSLSSRTAYLSDNLCSIVYDLDHDATNGSFSFWWGTGQRGLTYQDDYGLTKELFVRSSECSEM